MSLINFLRPPAPRPEKTVRVKIKSSIMAKAWDAKTASPAEVGEVIEMTENDASQLVNDGNAEWLERLDKKGARVEPSKPPTKAVPEPVPASFADLPVTFEKAWKIRAQARALAADLHAAQVAHLPPGFTANDLFLQVRVGLAEEHKINKQYEEVERAQKTLNDYTAANWETLGGLMIAAGQSVVTQVDRANALTAELAEVAFKIFHSRIAALGLHEDHERRLFEGSSLSIKYTLFRPVTAGHMIFLGGENPQIACDDELEGMSSYYRNAVARIAEIEPILVEAKAELEAAQGVVLKNKKAA